MDFIFVNYFLPLIGFFITLIAQIYLSVQHSRYKNIDSDNKLSGFEVARKILDYNGLNDIYITEVKGNLTDHYDPSRNVIRLSTDVFHDSSIASISVAAHECGHAIQNKEGYFFIKLRSFIFPFVNLSSKVGYFAIIIGLVFNYINLAWIGLILLCSILVFQLITLPTEFDASKKALYQLKELGIINNGEIKSSKKMLTAAALTYVAGLLTTFLEVFRLLLIIFSRSND